MAHAGCALFFYGRLGRTVRWKHLGFVRRRRGGRDGMGLGVLFGAFLGWRLRIGNYPIDAAILLPSWRFGISNGLMGTWGRRICFLFPPSSSLLYRSIFEKRPLYYLHFLLSGFLLFDSFSYVHFGIRFLFRLFETLHHHLHVAASGFGAGVRAVFLFLFIILLLRLGLFKKNISSLPYHCKKKNQKGSYYELTTIFVSNQKKKAWALHFHHFHLFISHIRDHQFIHAKGQNDHTLSSSTAYCLLPYPTTLLHVQNLLYVSM